MPRQLTSLGTPSVSGADASVTLNYTGTFDAPNNSTQCAGGYRGVRITGGVYTSGGTLVTSLGGDGDTTGSITVRAATGLANGTYYFQFQSTQVRQLYNSVDVSCDESFSGTSSTITSSNFTIAGDFVPDAFDLGPDVSPAALNTYYYSNIITISGMSSGATATATISGTGGEFKKNSGSYTTANQTVQNGDTLRVRVLSANAASTTRTGLVDISGVTDSFSATTPAGIAGGVVYIKSSGSISMLDVWGVMGGAPSNVNPNGFVNGEVLPTAPIGLDIYYRGGANVPDTPYNSGVPASGQISLSQFYGAGKPIQIDNTYLPISEVLTTGSPVNGVTNVFKRSYFTVSSGAEDIECYWSYTQDNDAVVVASSGGVVNQWTTNRFLILQMIWPSSFGSGTISCQIRYRPTGQTITTLTAPYILAINDIR